MSDQHIFLSDLHHGAVSGEEARRIESDFTALIDFCMENRIQLHILGDLFDYWMEYPGYHPGLGSAIVEKLRQYISERGPLLYITGNHDYWTRGYFENIGFDVEHEYRILELDGRVVFLHHGDGLDAPHLELRRPLFHRLLRNPRFVKYYQKILPPGPGLKLMKQVSKISRARPDSQSDRLDRWAADYMSKNDAEFVICGHDHLPRLQTFQSGTYINSGAFYLHRTIVRYTKGSFELVVWNGEGRQTIPYRQ